MGIDEQREEREVLEAIFPDEITEISETDFRISIQLDALNSEGEQDEDAPIILLKVEYPPGYPDEAPRLDLLSPPNAPKYDFFDIQDDKEQLLESLEPTVEENLGMAMVFALVSSVKDAAESLILERQKAVQAVREKERARIEAEENKKFNGTPVNRDTFMAWRNKFRQEIADEEQRRKEEQEVEDKKKRGFKEDVKLTGKQLWERGLAGKIEDDDDEEDEDALDGMVAKVKIEA